MCLDFARRIQRCDPRRHPRSREFLGLQPVSIGLLYPGSHRYKELLHAIPHHSLDIGQIVAYFHQGLSLYSKQYIQMMSGGQFYEKILEEVVQCFDIIAKNARNWETNTSLDATRVHSMPTGGGKHHVKKKDDLQAKIAIMTRKLEAIEMQKVNEVTIVPKVPSAPTGLRWKTYVSFMMTPLI